MSQAQRLPTVSLALRTTSVKIHLLLFVQDRSAAVMSMTAKEWVSFLQSHLQPLPEEGLRLIATQLAEPMIVA